MSSYVFTFDVRFIAEIFTITFEMNDNFSSILS